MVQDGRYRLAKVGSRVRIPSSAPGQRPYPPPGLARDAVVRAMTDLEREIGVAVAAAVRDPLAQKFDEAKAEMQAAEAEREALIKRLKG